jgi:hypothetical protein
MALSIQKIFRELMTKNQPVLLINHFNGVTVANHSQVRGFNRTSVKVSVNKYQGVVLQHEHQTLMIVEGCNNAIQARVDVVNLLAREAYLTEFRFVEKLLNSRQQVRICPRDDITASFPEHPEIEGKIYDMSFDGLGFYIPREDSNYGKFAKGEQIMINMNLPLKGAEKQVQVHGEIRKVFLEGEDLRLRIGVKTQPDVESRKAIASYIAQNMVEIVNELDNMYKEQAREPVFLPGR